MSKKVLKIFIPVILALCMTIGVHAQTFVIPEFHVDITEGGSEEGDGYMVSVFKGFNEPSVIYLTGNDGGILKSAPTESHAFNFKQVGSHFGYLTSDGFQFLDNDLEKTRMVTPVVLSGDLDIHDHIYHIDGTHFFSSYGTRSQEGGHANLRIEQVSENGESLWVWQSLDHLNPDHSPYEIVDWHHFNSMRFSDHDTLILSLRNMNSVVAINYPSGNVEWILGGPENQFRMPIRNLGENSYWFCAQHDVKFIPELNTVTMFDNGTGCRNFSRSVEYLLDFDNMIVTQATQYTGTQEGVYAFAMGSYDKIGENGGLISWGSSSLGRLFGDDLLMATEFKSGNPVAEFYWNEKDTYALYNIRKYYKFHPTYLPLVKQSVE